jgi:hypothetical protein
MVSLVASIAVLLTLALTGCDDDDSSADSVETGDEPVQITGASDEDQAIADDLWEYVRRMCLDVEPPPASELEPAVRRGLTRKYGSVEQAFESFERSCESYERISVEDRVITASTNLAADEQGELVADHVCNTIQGSDVADRETHTILDTDGELLFSCRGAGP